MTSPTDQSPPTSWRRPGWLRRRSANTPTDRRPTADRPTVADHKATVRRPARGRSVDLDDRARRAQLTSQTGAAGLPTGYTAAFAVLVGGSVTAGLVSFLFSFGNVRWLNIWLGLPGWIQPLVSPAVDVSVIVLVVVIQYLSLAGAPKSKLRSANAFLIGAGLAMLGANVAPSLILAMTAETSAEAGRLYGRAVVEALAPLGLVAWSHVGPSLVRVFAWVRDRADQAALAVVELRTLATEADRAAAAADRSAAAGLVADAQAEAGRIRAAADQALAAADQIRQAAADQAAADQRARRLADQVAADQLEADRREAERAARRLADQAAADQAAADQAAKLVADREKALADRRRELEAAADQAAADRRAAAELLAEAERSVVGPVRPTDRPTRTARPRNLAPVPDISQTDRPGQAARGTRDELARQRAEVAKRKFPDWESSLPTKRSIMAELSIHGEAALDVRKVLESEQQLAVDKSA